MKDEHLQRLAIRGLDSGPQEPGDADSYEVFGFRNGVLAEDGGTQIAVPIACKLVEGHA